MTFNYESGDFVKRTGDTISGDITIDKTNPRLNLLDNDSYAVVGNVGNWGTGAGSYITFYGKDFVGENGRMDLVSKDSAGTINSSLSFTTYAILCNGYFRFDTGFLDGVVNNNSIYMDNSNNLKWKKGGTSYTLATTADLSDYVKKAGDTMTGSLNMGSDGSGKKIYFCAIDGTNEGGEFTMNGAGAYSDWTVDNYQGTMRFLVGAGVQFAIRTTGVYSSVPFYVYSGATEKFAVDNSTGDVTLKGMLHPTSSTDASASNNSVYYSTTASKLVYKDSGGTVHNLY